MGVRLRDALFSRSLFTGPIRRVLQDAVQRASGHPERLAAAADHIEGLIDTWPLAAMVDSARRRWRRGPDGHALAVLARCTEVMGPVLGWPRTVDRRWPLPDEDWMRQQVADGRSYAVVARGPRDGAAAVSVALNLPMAPAELVELPERIVVAGDELVARLDQIREQVIAGRLDAVELDGYIPHDRDTERARVSLRSILPRQEAIDSHGLAGLVAGSVPQFNQLLSKAPPGRFGPNPRAVADGLIVPLVSENKAPRTGGILVWDAAHMPVRVHPAAVEVLQKLDGRRTTVEVAEMVGAAESLVGEMVRELVALGAATS